MMDIIGIVLTAFGFNFEAQISLRDPNDHEKYVGTDEDWALAEKAIVEACQEKGLPAKVEYGEAAFYGPKLDFMIKDAIGRRWQLGTIQVDYNLPKRFQLEYTDEDNTKKTPVMIHRAPFGSLERFCAVLISPSGSYRIRWLSYRFRRSTTTMHRKLLRSSIWVAFVLPSTCVMRNWVVKFATTS